MPLDVLNLDVLVRAVDELVESDPAALADADSIRVLCRQISRLQGVRARSSASFETGGEWSLSGAKTAAAWMAKECDLPKGEARRVVHQGRQWRQLPALGSAWLEGAIGTDYFNALAAQHHGRTADLFERDQAMLLDQARKLRFEEFVRALSYWKQLADPDGAEVSDMERRARRDVHLQATIGGMWLGQMTFDPISGSIVSRELDRLERQLFAADWAQAKEALGRDPRLDELARTPGQRRADALVEMATRSASTPPDAQRPAPLFSVLVDYPTLHGRVCELAHGGIVVSPGSLLPWLDQAYIERAVFAPEGRVEVSHTARFFTGATRRAIELRDRECQDPYCDESSERCQADHIVLYSEGGPTTQENGRLLCGFHNRRRNQRPPPAD
jgi:hypothetical protein